MIHAPWYPVYSADFLSATRMMKASEVGVYAILQNLMHDRQGPILYDPTFLARYCNTSKTTLVSAVNRLVGDGLFSLKDGRLWSPYIQRQLENCKEKGEKARSAASARHKKNKENQSSSDADAMPYQKQTTDADVEGKPSQGASPSTTQPTTSSTKPDDKQDERPAAPGSASVALSGNLVSNDEVRYVLGILKDRDIKEAVLDKIWKVHTSRGLDKAMLRTIKQMAREGRLSAAEIDRVAGGANA